MIPSTLPSPVVRAGRGRMKLTLGARLFLAVLGAFLVVGAVGIAMVRWNVSEGAPAPKEFGVFAALVRRPGTVWTRAQLLEAIRSDALGANDRAIDSHVKNLRRKIERHLPGENVVESVYGLGYRLGVPCA
jgi:DNA-binding response OmpR family regulator